MNSNEPAGGTATDHAWPEAASRREWEAASATLLAKEKAHTRAQDQLSALRRRLPMTPVSGDYRFADPSGEHNLADLFAGRTQLVLYHNMLTADDDWICRGCTMFADGLGGLRYLHARDTTFVMESAAHVSEIEAVKERFGWRFPWYSSYGTSFREDFLLSRGNAYAGLMVFVQREGQIYQTYQTHARGLDYVSSPRTLLDLTPFGRREAWEDSPAGWPQVPTHSWERLPDEF